MPLCRYPHTLGVIKERLAAAFPGVESEQGDSNDVTHTLWMIEEIQYLEEQGKIDRWIGWIGAKAHSLGVLGLVTGRDLVRIDLVESNEGKRSIT